MVNPYPPLLAWVRGPPVTGNSPLPLHPTDCSLLMSELVPLHQLPLTPSIASLAPSLAPSATSHERKASDAQSALRPALALTHSQERYVSDAQSALRSLPTLDQPSNLDVAMGSVTLEQPGAASPLACAQIPLLEAAAFASVRRSSPTGNSSLAGDHSDHLVRMSESATPLEALDELLRHELNADYLDLFRHASRRRSASFHALRSPEAVEVRAHCPHPPPGRRDRHSVLERHRHWSVSGTDLHAPDFEMPYRLL